MKDSNFTKNDTLEHLFVDNRAEWPAGQFKDLFVEPTYLKKLESMRPCFLSGGRGTGKTTALQSLRYDSSLERLEAEGLGFGELEYLGILIRMNKNRVLAFQGGPISADIWKKAFTHFINLLACLELVNMLLWLEEKSGVNLDNDSLERVSTDLGLPAPRSSLELKALIKKAISTLQLAVNNSSKDLNSIQFSMAEVPLRTLAEALIDSKLIGERIIFCCIDEYENLLEYQQAILNTYIKHAEPPLSYKIGVRINGFKTKETLDGHDPIKTPDDYADIKIAEEAFEYFARNVALKRLTYASKHSNGIPGSLAELLEDLTFTEELKLLGADKIADEVLTELKAKDKTIFNTISSKPKSEVYFLAYWSDKSDKPLDELAKDWLENESTWRTRLENHGFASLFWLSKGKKGVRTRKYYCGERTFLTLPSGNIRYFLELIDAAISNQLDFDRETPRKGIFTLSPKAQTQAAKDVGQRRLNQLEELAENGVHLKRLVLGIGKVFFELARSAKTAPEVNSFVISGDTEDKLKIEKLLSDGQAHLAFEAEPRTKATTNLELRDDEYRLHRIFSGFFEISHRKKRRVTFNASDLLSILSDQPSRAISSLLAGEKQSDESDLPEQLALFNSFYDERQKED